MIDVIIYNDGGQHPARVNELSINTLRTFNAIFIGYHCE